MNNFISVFTSYLPAISMKSLGAILLLLFQISIYGQHYWSIVKDDQGYNKSELHDAVLYKDSLIILGGYVNIAACYYPVLSAYDLSGTLRWEHTYVGSHTLYADEEFLYSVGYNIGADDVINDQYLNITKLDFNGNEVFNTYFPIDDPFDGGIDYDPFFCSIPNSVLFDYFGDILIGIKNALLKADPSGNVKYLKKYSFPTDIVNVTCIDTQQYLITTGLHIYKTDTAGILTDSTAVSHNCIKSLYNGGVIYQMAERHLTTIDTSFSVFSSIFSTEEYRLCDMEFFEDFLWLMGIKDESITIWKISDNQILDTLTFPILLENPLLLVKGQDFFITGNSGTGQIACYHLNADYVPEEITFPDIEISDLYIDSINIQYYEWGGNKYLTGYRFNAAMSIHNAGNDTIHSFALWANLYGGFNCSQNYFYRKISGVSINPDQTYVVGFKQIYGGWYSNEELSEQELCFQCLAPNSAIESDLSKNILCKTIEFSGIKDIYLQGSVKIYPVPSDNDLHIEFPDNAYRTLMLIETTGKVLLTRKTSDSKTVFNLHGIKDGMYILRISTDESIYSRIIIKN